MRSIAGSSTPYFKIPLSEHDPKGHSDKFNIFRWSDLTIAPIPSNPLDPNALFDDSVSANAPIMWPWDTANQNPSYCSLHHTLPLYKIGTTDGTPVPKPWDTWPPVDLLAVLQNYNATDTSTLPIFTETPPNLTLVAGQATQKGMQGIMLIGMFRLTDNTYVRFFGWRLYQDVWVPAGFTDQKWPLESGWDKGLATAIQVIGAIAAAFSGGTLGPVGGLVEMEVSQSVSYGGISAGDVLGPLQQIGVV